MAPIVIIGVVTGVRYHTHKCILRSNPIGYTGGMDTFNVESDDDEDSECDMINDEDQHFIDRALHPTSSSTTHNTSSRTLNETSHRHFNSSTPTPLTPTLKLSIDFTLSELYLYL